MSTQTISNFVFQKKPFKYHKKRNDYKQWPNLHILNYSPYFNDINGITKL
jgi:hypothetical protein